MPLDGIIPTLKALVASG
jgi:Xaa-Pro aminopeptidase